jgi:hypothetical protein
MARLSKLAAAAGGATLVLALLAVLLAAALIARALARAWGPGRPSEG